MGELFSTWKTVNRPKLLGITVGDSGKELIETLAEDLLDTFRAAPLLDPYGVYQHLMDYWQASMQDDLDLITADGWVAAPTRIVAVDKKGKSKDKGWTCDLLPKPFIVARFFAAEQAELDTRQAELDAARSEQDELGEEHGGDEGVFGELDEGQRQGSEGPAPWPDPQP